MQYRTNSHEEFEYIKDWESKMHGMVALYVFILKSFFLTIGYLCLLSFPRSVISTLFIFFHVGYLILARVAATFYHTSGISVRY